MIPGDEKTINLWYDTWLKQSLQMQLHGPLPYDEEHRKVESIIKIGAYGNHWNLADLPFCLPKNICLEIASQPLPHPTNPQKNLYGN